MAELLNQKGMAAFLGVSRAAVQNAENRGRITCEPVARAGQGIGKLYNAEKCRVDWENNRTGNRTRPTRREMNRGAQPDKGAEGISPNDVTSQAGLREGEPGTIPPSKPTSAGNPKKPGKTVTVKQDPAEKSNLVTYADARAERESIKVKNEKIDLMIRQNKLIDIEKTTRFLTGFGHQLQQNIMNIPARMTGRLEKRQVIELENELRQALEGLLGISVNLESCLVKK